MHTPETAYSVLVCYFHGFKARCGVPGAVSLDLLR